MGPKSYCVQHCNSLVISDRGESPTSVVCVEKDECDSNPCRNGATCKDGVNTYQCQCRNGFRGLNCEIPIDYCASQPKQCQNGGFCRSISETASTTCDCPEGYTGDLCQEDVNECSNEPCLHAGTCVNTEGSFTCQCKSGWTGQRCEENSNVCEVDNPCENGATCVDVEVGGYKCNCLPGYTGDLCGVNIDECASSPCVNGGTCTDGINGYSCLCPAEFNGPTCLCPQGYTGENCSEKINACETSPCKHGATCVSLQVRNYSTYPAR